MSYCCFDEIYKGLKDAYGEVKPALVFSNTFELLIAVILSAQCTDKRVNIVTKELFSKYKTPEDFIALGEENLEKEIHSVGLSKAKSKNIISACETLVEKFGGIVPDTREELMTLAGVGRKTANVVMAVGYGKNAIAVDTHVFRVSNRIGIASSKDVLNTEKDLMKNIPEDKWSECHHLLIYHGRNVCKAQKPDCGSCRIKECCKYFKENVNEQNS